MKKLLSASALSGVLALSLVTGAAAHAPAQTATPTPTATPAPAPTPAPIAAPVQGKKRSVFVSVDTVQGALGSPAPAIGCSLTNLFQRGQQVVFRMWGINAKLGGAALTDKNVKSAEVIIPGLSAPLTMTYGNHGKAPNPVVAFWTAAWKIDAAYPVGVVDFTIVVKTKAVKVKGHKVKSVTSKFTQQGLAPTSRLTVTP